MGRVNIRMYAMHGFQKPMITSETPGGNSFSFSFTSLTYTPGEKYGPRETIKKAEDQKGERKIRISTMLNRIRTM